MRDPNRINKILKVIKIIWTECPDLRLLQLIINALHNAEMTITPSSVFHVEDEVLMEKLTLYGLEFVSDDIEDKLLVESGILERALKEAKE